MKYASFRKYLFPLQIEYTLITLNKDEERAQLSLVGPDILDALQQPESSDPLHHTTKWRPEYASYMIEGIKYSWVVSGACTRQNSLLPIVLFNVIRAGN